MFWGVYPRLCTTWSVVRIEWVRRAKCCRCRKNGRNAGESCTVWDITTQTQNKQCSWHKKFLLPSTLWVFFSMSSLQTHERRHCWVSSVTQTHFGEVWGENEKSSKSRRKKEKYTRSPLASYNASFMSARRFVEWVEVNILGFSCFLSFKRLRSRATGIRNAFQ